MTAASTTRPQRLWLALRFPDLCLKALGLPAAEACEMITEKQKVFYASPAARQQGVTLDMNISSAQLLSGCEARARDIQLEREALQKLAQTLYQFSPYIEEYVCRHEYGLLLEVSQCLRLFNGVENLCKKVFRCLQASDFAFQYGLAHTAKGAWLLSYYHYSVKHTDNREVFMQRLHQVPLLYLKQHAKQVEKLEKSGFQCLGDIAKQINTSSIGSLQRRFDAGFVEAVCEIFDIERNLFQASLFQKPRTTYKPKEDFRDVIDFDYPVKNLEQLKPALRQLLQQLENYFMQRQCEFKVIHWHLYDISSNQFSVTVQSTYPQISSNIFYDLSCIKLEAQALPFEVDSLALSCDSYQVIHSRNRDLVFSSAEDKQSGEESFSLTAAKLRALLGEQAVFKMSYQDSHVPEISNARVKLEEPVEQRLPVLYQKAPRPTWLFYAPQRMSFRKQGLYWQGLVSLVSKAERIDTLWWEQGLKRDYFLAQRQDHVYLWVFQDLENHAWYVHGVFA